VDNKRTQRPWARTVSPPVKEGKGKKHVEGCARRSRRERHELPLTGRTKKERKMGKDRQPIGHYRHRSQNGRRRIRKKIKETCGPREEGGCADACERDKEKKKYQGRGCTRGSSTE